MAIVPVASLSAAPGANGGTSAAIDTTGANCLVISVAHSGAVTLSDSKSNTWVPLTQQAMGLYGRFYYCLSPSVGSGHTFTVAGSGTSPTFHVYAFSGVASYQTESGANSYGASSQASGSVTPSANGALVLTGFAEWGTATESLSTSGFTVRSDPFVGGASYGLGSGYLIQTTAAAINPTWTWTPGGASYVCVTTAVFLPAAAAGPALVASVSLAPSGNAGGTSAAITTTGATLLVISASWYHGFTTVTVSDSKGNTWLPLTERTADNGSQRFWYCLTPTVGTGHTFTISGVSGNTYSSAIIYAFSGVGSYQTESGSGTTGSGPLASGSVTPSANGALVLTALAANDNATDAVAPAGFALTTIPNAAGSYLQTSAAWQVQATAAAINPTWSWSAGIHSYVAVATAVFLPTAAPTSLTRVQAAPKVSGNPANITFTTPPTLGNGIVVPVIAYGGTIGASACTDNRGHTYTLAVTRNNGSALVGIYYCPKVTATGAPFTITVTGATAVATAIEVSGLAGNSLLIDQLASATGSSATPSTGTTPALTGTNDFAVIAFTFGGSLASTTVESVVPAWTQDLEDLTWVWATGEADSRALTGVSGTTQSGSWTNSGAGTWAAAIVVFTAGTPPATESRVTQDAIEILSLPFPDARVTAATIELLSSTAAAMPTIGRVTQDVIELLTQSAPPPADARLTQDVIELLTPSDPLPSRVTQLAVEVFAPPIVTVRTTQLAVEIFAPPIVTIRNTQLAVEYFTAPPPRGRATQLAVEIFLILPPCYAGEFPIDSDDFIASPPTAYAVPDWPQGET